MADDSERRPQELDQPSTGKVFLALIPNLVVNGVFPIVLYQLLAGHGVRQVPALVAGSLFPIGYSLFSWVRTRRWDVIATISLVFIIVSAATSLISGSPQFILVKESVFTGIFGLTFFGSLFASRPLMFYIVRQFSTGGDPKRVDSWNERWQYPGFRHSMQVMTVVWGAAFISDALIRTVLVFVLPTSTFLVVSQALFYGMFASTLALTMAYGRRAQRRAQAQHIR